MIRLKVKEAAKARGISLNKLSRMADMDYKTVRRMANEPNRYVDLETLDKIALALKCDVSELVETVQENS